MKASIFYCIFILKPTKSMEETRCKRKFYWTKQFNKTTRVIQINIMKVCSTDRELRLVNEISWRHVCASISCEIKIFYYFNLPLWIRNIHVINNNLMLNWRDTWIEGFLPVYSRELLTVAADFKIKIFWKYLARVS